MALSTIELMSQPALAVAAASRMYSSHAHRICFQSRKTHVTRIVPLCNLLCGFRRLVNSSLVGLASISIPVRFSPSEKNTV